MRRWPGIRLVGLAAITVAGLAAACADASEMTVSSRRVETVCPADTPVFMVHLKSRLVLTASDSVWVGGLRFTRGVDYWVDYAQGIVYFTEALEPGDCVLVKYTAFPLPLRQDYRLRALSANVRNRDSKGPGTVTPSKKAGRYDIKATGFKTVSVEVGTLKDVQVNQSLSLSIGGKLGDNVDVRGVLTDRDLSLEQRTATTNLKDLDRVFMEVSSPQAAARLGDLEISQDAGELLRFKRTMTGFLGSASRGPGTFTASGAMSRSRYETHEIRGQEGIAGPYIIRTADGERATILTNSEKVWLDGKPMKRGSHADYVIDYTSAEIHFNPKYLIRDGARILVDCESLDQGESRQLYFGRTDLNLGERASVALSFVSEGYSASSLGYPDDNLSGDGTRGSASGWSDGGEFVGPAGGDYVKVERDTCCYYEYVGEGAGDYRVTFTRVGEDAGRYSYIYSETWERYVHIYTGTGAYVDKVEVKPDVGNRIMHVNASAHVTDWLEISSEAAQSRADLKDADGRWGRQKDAAYVVNLSGGGDLPAVGETKPGAVDFSIKRRSVGTNYTGLDRIREPGVLETWAIDPGQGLEQTDEFSLAYRYGQKVEASAAGGFMNTDQGRSRRNKFGLDVGDERLGLSACSEVAEVSSADRNRGIRKNSLGLRLPVAFMRLGLGRDYELRAKVSDSTSVEREEYYSRLTYAGGSGSIGLSLAAGSERRDVGPALEDYASTVEARLDFQANRGRTFSVIGGVAQRRLDYDERVEIGDQRFTTGDLRLNLRDVLAISSLSAGYRLANTLSSVYETKLIKVESGGDYDSLGNYVPGTGGYALSRYEHGQRPVTRVKADIALEVGRKSKVLLDRSLSSRTGIDIEGESSSGDTRVALLDPAFLLGDASMAYSNLEVSQDLIFRRKSGMVLSMDGLASRMLDHRCEERVETRDTRQIQARAARPFAGGLNLALDGRVTRTDSEVRTERWTTRPERLAWATKLSLEKDLSGRIRGTMRIEYLDENRTRPESGFAQITLSPSLTVLAEAIRCDAGMDVKRIVSVLTPAGGVAPWHDSVSWHSRLNMRHGRYTSVSLEYVGRSGGGLATSHNLRASLSAAF